MNVMVLMFPICQIVKTMKLSMFIVLRHLLSKLKTLADPDIRHGGTKFLFPFETILSKNLTFSQTRVSHPRNFFMTFYTAISSLKGREKSTVKLNGEP